MVIFPANIIVDNKLTFIDMDVCNILHHWYNLTINTCNMGFPNFYSGVIEFYFQNNIYRDFWKVYTLFLFFTYIRLYFVRVKD